MCRGLFCAVTLNNALDYQTDRLYWTGLMDEWTRVIVILILKKNNNNNTRTIFMVVTL